jgi:outer membrane receptor protein involved in Fe transport
MVKAFAEVQVRSNISVDVGLVAVSSSFARGNENNEHQPDGTYYLGDGAASGYGVVNLGARYGVVPKLELLFQINNLFNRRYYSGAQLGPVGFTSSGSFIARPFPAITGEFPVQQGTFLAPGAPAAFWVGTRVKF